MFIFQSQAVVAWAACWKVREVAKVTQRMVSKILKEPESPQASAKPQIQENKASNRQMPWNARRGFVGLTTHMKITLIYLRLAD